MPVKKGLISPQNTFVEAIIRKYDGSPDRNFVLGNAQVDDLPIIFCNDGFCELTGYSRAELVQRHCSCDFLCGEETNMLAADEIKDALQGDQEKHVEILYYRKDGSKFLCSVLIAPLKNDQGLIMMYIVNHEDVTCSPNREDISRSSPDIDQGTSYFEGSCLSLKKMTKKKPWNNTSSKKSEKSSSSQFDEKSDSNSALESPSSIPLMQLRPPTPPSPENINRSCETNTNSLPRRKISSSLSDVAALSFPQVIVYNNQPKQRTASFSVTNYLELPKEALSASNSDSNLFKIGSRSVSFQDLRKGVKTTDSCERFRISIPSTPPQPQVLQHRKTEKVAQVMSLGADVLPEYKLQAPQIHPWTILHYSLFKAIWDWLILLLVFYTAIITPYMASFFLSQDRVREELDDNPETQVDHPPYNMYTDPLVIVDYIVDVMFIIDIFINFRTTYVDSNDEIVSSPCKVAVHYMKTWFVVDLLAAIPFELLIMIGDTDQTTTLIGLLKTARLLRLVRVARKVDYYSEYGAAVLCLFMCSFALLAHWLACIWYFIGQSERGNIYMDGWLDSLAVQTNRPFNDSNPHSGPDATSRYVTALYFTLSSLTSVGFGNVSPNTNAEKIFSICVMLVGSLFYAAIFGNVAAIIARLYSGTARYHSQMQKIREFVRFHQIPSPMRQRIEDYSQHLWSYTNGIDTSEILSGFPECLQADICLHLNKKLLYTNEAFKHASQGCLRALSLRLHTIHLPPGDYILYNGDEINHLYFIVRGTIEILGFDDIVMAILGKGDTFGENFAVEPDKPVEKSATSVRALTYCDLHTIARDDLLFVINAYPEFREAFNADLQITYRLKGTDIGNYKVQPDYNVADEEKPMLDERKEPHTFVLKPSHESTNERGNFLTQDQYLNNSIYHYAELSPTSNIQSDMECPKREGLTLPTNLDVPNITFNDLDRGTECGKCDLKCHRKRFTMLSAKGSNKLNNSCPAMLNDLEQGRTCNNCRFVKNVEEKLESLASRLDRLESKLSTDMEAIFDLLQNMQPSEYSPKNTSV